MSAFKQRIVLKAHVSGSDVELFAWDQNWNLYEMNQKEAGALIDIWRTDDERCEIHYVDDRPIGMRYVTLRGDAADELAESVREGLDVWSFLEARRAVAEARDTTERLTALYVFALTAPGDQDDLAAQELAAMSDDPAPRIRKAFVEAVGYLPWPALLGKIEELQHRDPDLQVRKAAGILMEGIRRHGAE